MTRRWIIIIDESDTLLTAHVYEKGTDHKYDVIIRKADYPNRDEAVADLFAGPSPNLRDDFDRQS